MLLKISCTVVIINSLLILFGSIPSAAFNQTISPRSRAYLNDCADAKAMSLPSGVYEIVIPSYSETPFKVRCDSETHGGGWTVILRRFNGSESFYRSWNSYKIGFGNLEGEFFLGLDTIHTLTTQTTQQLLVVLEDQDGIEKYELYDKFAIGDEKDKYRLITLGEASGTAGDSFKTLGSKFSTFDQDNDGSDYNCALKQLGGWWYDDCYGYTDRSRIRCHLTGGYNDFYERKGINWDTFHHKDYSHKKAAMMIRPKN